MKTNDDFSSESEFLVKLVNNKLKTPNEFTHEMGKLIREAREEKSLSQVELAQKINRRPATISAIENGKSDISVLTLVLFSIVLSKPISYFIPSSIVKYKVVDVQTHFQYTILELAKIIEYFGDIKITKDILQLLHDRFEDKFEEAMQGYPSQPGEDEFDLSRKQ